MRICLLLLSMFSLLIVRAQDNKGPDPKPTVVFVCEHGSAKSVIAAVEFKRMAKENGLDVNVLTRGTNPDPEIAGSRSSHPAAQVVTRWSSTERGPKLAGVFRRTSGTAPGFIYSFALKKAGVKWDEQSLDKRLANRDAAVPMSNMYFHVARAEQRRNLIAYLKASAN
jgi:hypothetical protein